MKHLLGVVLLLVFASCGRDTQYLNHITGVEPTYFETPHKLKELQGETKVDILWVIDNSGSMGSYQQDLIRNAGIFINTFVAKGGLEWKMGIVSTSLNENPYIGFTPTTLLTYMSADPIRDFQRAVSRLGINGDVTEQTLAPIRKHLTTYPDFIRKQATLAVIMLTDAEEQSRIPAKDILTFLEKTKGDIKKVVNYGVFAAQDFGCQMTDGFWNYVGSPYEALIKATGGKHYKLCNNDFGKDLADLGSHLVERIKRPFIQLPDRPQIDTLRVTYVGKDLPGGPEESGGFWVYDFDMNRVVFHNLDFAPGDDEQVSVAYEIAKY